MLECLGCLNADPRLLSRTRIDYAYPVGGELRRLVHRCARGGSRSAMGGAGGRATAAGRLAGAFRDPGTLHPGGRPRVRSACPGVRVAASANAAAVRSRPNPLPHFTLAHDGVCALHRTRGGDLWLWPGSRRLPAKGAAQGPDGLRGGGGADRGQSRPGSLLPQHQGLRRVRGYSPGADRAGGPIDAQCGGHGKPTGLRSAQRFRSGAVCRAGGSRTDRGYLRSLRRFLGS